MLGYSAGKAYGFWKNNSGGGYPSAAVCCTRLFLPVPVHSWPVFKQQMVISLVRTRPIGWTQRNHCASYQKNMPALLIYCQIYFFHALAAALLFQEKAGLCCFPRYGLRHYPVSAAVFVKYVLIIHPCAIFLDNNQRILIGTEKICRNNPAVALISDREKFLNGTQTGTYVVFLNRHITLGKAGHSCGGGVCAARLDFLTAEI